MMPRNNVRLSTSWGLVQLTIAVSLVRSGETLLGPTRPPAMVVSVMKNQDFAADNDSLHSCILVKILCSFLAISSKEFAAAPLSSTKSSMMLSVIRLCRFVAIMCAKVEGACVSPKGIMA